MSSFASPGSKPDPNDTVEGYVDPWLSQIAYALAHFGLLPFYFQKISILGQEHIPASGPVILAPTHRSRWDAIIVPYATGRRVSQRHVYFMVSRNEMRGGQGWLIRHLGGFPVNTDHPGRRTIRCSLKLLKGQKMIVVFPEGDIYQDGQLHSLKPGLAYLALQTARTHNLNVQVVPIAIQYSQATPTWRCSVKMKIAPTLNTRSYGNLAFKQGTEQLTADLANVLGTLVQELSS